VYPPEVTNPARLPILGLRGIFRNGLEFTNSLQRDTYGVSSPPTHGWCTKFVRIRGVRRKHMEGPSPLTRKTSS